MTLQKRAHKGNGYNLQLCEKYDGDDANEGVDDEGDDHDDDL